MDIIHSMPYIPGKPVRREYPLQRFLPILPEGIVQSWLNERLLPGQSIIDPFGASPLLPFEAIDAGASILVACNNPILQFYIELLASAPGEGDFHTALAALAHEKHQGERLDVHLQRLYETHCPACAKVVQAQAFLWKKTETTPYARLIACPACKTEGEFPITREDLLKLDAIGNDALHRARALQRANLSPETSEGAEEVAHTYLARPLYFLFTLINRIDRLLVSDFQRRLLYALLIHALDMGNSIWSWPSSRARPRQINIPSQFVEHNLWLALEKGISLWTLRSQPVPLTAWPEMPESPGICLYRGRISGLWKPDALRNSSGPALCVFPRPNQAFWSLSAVWSGWLWGPKIAHGMRSALERKRFDWYWFSSAIHQSLVDLHRVLGENQRVFGLLPEVEPGFVTASIIAAEYAGFSLEGIAYRHETDLAQCQWQTGKEQRAPAATLDQLDCLEPVTELLTYNNEPAEREKLFLACLAEISRRGMVPPSRESLPYYTIRDYQQKISTLLDNARLFKRSAVQTSQGDHEVLWLLQLNEREAPVLSERVEEHIHSSMQQKEILTFQAIDRDICLHFKGLSTPDIELVKRCVIAYGEEIARHPDTFRLKEEAQARNVEEQRAALIKDLHRLGEAFGFQIEQPAALMWRSIRPGRVGIWFHIISDAAISRLVFQGSQTRDVEMQVILFPDHLAALLEYRLKTNPRLQAALHRFGRLLPFSRVRQFCQRDEYRYTDFLSMLDRGLSSYEGPSQIPIFE